MDHIQFGIPWSQFHACSTVALLTSFINFFLFYSAQMYISVQCQGLIPIIHTRA